MKAAFTKEIDFFAERGIKYLDPALHLHRADAAASSQLFERFGDRCSASPRTRATSPATQALEGDGHRRRRPAGEGRARSSRRSRRRTASRSCMLGRPYHSDPGLNHGVLEEFQVLGYPILSMRSIPKDPEWLAPLLRERHQGGAHRDAARDAATCGRRTTRPTRRRRSGRRSSRRATRTSSCSICRRSSAATTRRPTASSTRSSRRRRRRTRRCTTSTPTSRAARSRSASRPTPTR